MKIVVGGLGRKSGKTSMVCRILRLFPGRAWLAVKVSSHEHAPLGGQGFSITEEREPGLAGDTRRYLEAGAKRALLVEGDPEQALPALRAELAQAADWIVETNALATRLHADFTFFVADPLAGAEDEKLRRFFSGLE